MDIFSKQRKVNYPKESLLFWILFISIIAFRVLLITGIPKMFIYGPLDDLFFPRAAHFILQGQWMGPYNHLTLIKSPFYSFFLIGSLLTGLPLFLNETLFFIGSTIVLFFAIKPLVKNHWWRLIGFVLVLFIPQSLTIRLNLRIYREFVYFTLSLLVTAFAIGLFLRVNQKPATMFLWSLGLGMSMGAFLITREEGIWIYPILFFLLISALFFVWLDKGTQKIKRSLLILLPVLLWYIPTIVISHINYFHYGYWGVSEQLDDDLNSLLNNLARIETDSDWHPAIQISKQARFEAYEASPSLNVFQETIEYYVILWNESDDSTMALKPAWYLNEYGNGGEEIGNGHFLWLIRDVIAMKGYYSEGRYPKAIFRTISNELEKACEDGTLDCQKEQLLPAMVGSIEDDHLPIIVRMLRENFINILEQDYIGVISLDIPNTWPAWPSGNDEYWIFEQFANNPINTIDISSTEWSKQELVVNRDLRFKLLQNKERIIRKILDLYRIISFPIFILSLLAFILLIIEIILKRGNNHWINYLVISVFLLGLLFTRLLTLTIIDATTSIRGINYSASIYIFLYIFSFIMIYWGISFTKNSLSEKVQEECFDPILHV